MAFKSSQVNFIAIKTSSGQWRKSGLSLRKCCSVWKHTCLYINCVTSGYFCVRWELRGNVAVWPCFSLLFCLRTFDLSLLFSLFLLLQVNLLLQIKSQRNVWDLLFVCGGHRCVVILFKKCFVSASRCIIIAQQFSRSVLLMLILSTCSTWCHVAGDGCEWPIRWGE